MHMWHATFACTLTVTVFSRSAVHAVCHLNTEMFSVT